MNTAQIKLSLIATGAALMVAVFIGSWQANAISLQAKAIPATAPHNSSSIETQEAREATEKPEIKPAETTTVTAAVPVVSEIVKPETKTAQKPKEDEGAPVGWVDAPPLCGSMTHGDLSSLPVTFSSHRDEWQTEVTISKYNYYVNGVLKQSSNNPNFTLEATSPGDHIVHSILHTNFGITLESSRCKATVTVTETMLSE